jgi:hypothetical protein
MVWPTTFTFAPPHVSPDCAHVTCGQNRAATGPRDRSRRRIDNPSSARPQSFSAGAARSSIKDLLFCYPDSSAYGRYVARSPTERICAHAGLEPFNIHMTRHCHASHLVQRGVPLAVAASLLGQTVLQVTAKYAHLAPSTLREAIQVLTARAHIGHMSGPVRDWCAV